MNVFRQVLLVVIECLLVLGVVVMGTPRVTTTASTPLPSLPLSNREDVSALNMQRSLAKKMSSPYVHSSSSASTQEKGISKCSQELQPFIRSSSSSNPFQNTILNDVVNFPWRPCKTEWQYEHGSLNHSLLDTPPSFFTLFDWVVWQHDMNDVMKTKDVDTKPKVVFGNYCLNNQPRTILAYPEPHSLGFLKRRLRDHVKPLQSGQRRTLVIAGQDTGLGGKLQKSIHKHLLIYFSDIWCTAKDRPDPFVHALPLGLNAYYVVKAGVKEVTDIVLNRHRHNNPLQQYNSSSGRKLWSLGRIVADMIHPPKEMERKLVFAAWGSVWKFLDSQLKDRVSLISFLDLPSTKTWLQRSDFPMLEYWQKLSEYKYSICPPGNGVQTPKIFEAILSHTVPVTLSRPAFRDLKSLGVPILLVDAWTDINASYLESLYETEYRYVNWEKAADMLRPSRMMHMLLNSKVMIPRNSTVREKISQNTLRLPSKVESVMSMSHAGKISVTPADMESVIASRVEDPGPAHNCSTKLLLGDSLPSPFVGTLLSEVVTFHWRPCFPSWQFSPGTLEHTLLSTPPPIFKLFDWVIWQHDFEGSRSYSVFGNNTASLQPRSILVHPDPDAMLLLRSLLWVIKKCKSGQRRTLVIAGQDTGLGGYPQYNIHKTLLNYFSDIWCTAKDRPDPFVHAIPLGLNPYYLVSAGIHDVAKIVHTPKSTLGRKLAFSAWGKVWKHLDGNLAARASLISFLDLPSTKTWLQRSDYTMLEYWQKLSEYKYSICPPGNGVQTPKIFEAILSHTVPVTLSRPAFRDLKSLGIPIILLNNWTDLSESFLKTSYEREFNDVDWEKAKDMLRPSSIMRLILNWNDTIPSLSKKRVKVSKETLKYYKWKS